MKLYTFFKIYRKYKEETVAIFSILLNQFRTNATLVLDLETANSMKRALTVSCTLLVSSRASFGLVLRAGSLCGAFSEPLYIITIYMILIVNYQYQPKHI